MMLREKCLSDLSTTEYSSDLCKRDIEYDSGFLSLSIEFTKQKIAIVLSTREQTSLHAERVKFYIQYEDKKSSDFSQNRTYMHNLASRPILEEPCISSFGYL